MKIIVLEGSPNQHGSSNMLADNFIRGAEEAGHTEEVRISMVLPICWRTILSGARKKRGIRSK